MGLCSRCWSPSVMSVLLPLFLVSVFARANSVMGNTSELVSAANETSLPGESEKLEGVSEATKPIGDVYLVLRSGRKPRDEMEQGSGLQEEEVPLVTDAPEHATPDQRHIAISPDSAETDHLLPHQTTEEEDEDEEEPEPEVVTAEPTRNGVKADTEVTVFNLDPHESQTTSIPAAPPSHPDVLTVDFTASRGRELLQPSPSAHELQGRDPTTWTIPDDHNYLTPYLPHDNAASPASEEHSFPADTYEEELTTPPPPKPFVPRLPAPPAPAADGGPSSTTHGECRHGFVRSNGTCRSQCDTVPGYCFNGGQCYELEAIGVFCRCNIQDYVWHKGARCESVITEFQVLCIAVGASALTVLLLFMIVVCFAKKLHVLKTENNKLRKRSSKYRPSSEQHNDNFSLSTIAEGSHPNKTMSRYTWECKTKEEPVCEDDPTAQNKLEEPVKAPPPKEEETLNIQNSLTPKHENHKMVGEENSSEVNSLQNNMM
ncbi:uncharacterized protein cspg5a isoform X3 [Brachyhypopomus gauderio]|uniref:uncharacterized protein cspg5a isoform X3 n=1 Tax=Brachyhypopomus gauderio TaxID=698409 RepID=UPI004041292E